MQAHHPILWSYVCRAYLATHLKRRRSSKNTTNPGFILGWTPELFQWTSHCFLLDDFRYPHELTEWFNPCLHLLSWLHRWPRRDTNCSALHSQQKHYPRIQLPPSAFLRFRECFVFPWVNTQNNNPEKSLIMENPCMGFINSTEGRFHYTLTGDSTV